MPPQSDHVTREYCCPHCSRYRLRATHLASFYVLKRAPTAEAIADAIVTHQLVKAMQVPCGSCGVSVVLLLVPDTRSRQERFQDSAGHVSGKHAELLKRLAD